jgi:hypothetical protein
MKGCALDMQTTNHLAQLLVVLARSRIVRTAILLVAGYWMAALLLPSIILIQALNYVLISVALAVSIAYLPDVLHAIRMDRVDRVAQLSLGIALSWMAVLINRSWVGVIRVTDAEWMRTSPVIGFYVFLSVLAGVLHITAPGAVDGVIPKRNQIILGVAIGVGLLVAWVVIWLGLGEEFILPNPG